MKTILIRASLALAFVAALSVAGFAQQSGTPTAPNAGAQQEQPGMNRRGMRGERGGRGGRGGMRALQQLNLSDQQREQLRGIMSRNAESTRTLREELRGLREQMQSGNADATARAQTLRQQLRQSQQQMRGEINALLTDEQRTQLQQIQNQMREQMRQRRQQMQNNNQPQSPTP